MRLRVITPQFGAVSLDEATAHCRVMGTYDDVLIEGMIDAATAHIQMLAGRAFGFQTWEAIFDTFPSGNICLNFGPVSDVVSIIYRDSAGDQQTIPPENYELLEASPEGVIVPLESWPTTDGSPNAVVIEFNAGESFPLEIKQAVLMLVAHWYENRESAAEKPYTEVPFAVSALVGLHRRMFV
jgi:uncharacterized phiE125 gp8 family phage protein